MWWLGGIPRPRYRLAAIANLRDVSIVGYEPPSQAGQVAAGEALRDWVPGYGLFFHRDGHWPPSMKNRSRSTPGA